MHKPCRETCFTMDWSKPALFGLAFLLGRHNIWKRRSRINVGASLTQRFEDMCPLWTQKTPDVTKFASTCVRRHETMQTEELMNIFLFRHVQDRFSCDLVNTMDWKKPNKPDAQSDLNRRWSLVRRCLDAMCPLGYICWKCENQLLQKTD